MAKQIEVSTQWFEAVQGYEPSNYTSQLWKFYLWLCEDQPAKVPVFYYSGKYSVAKAAAVKLARDTGASWVQVVPFCDPEFYLDGKPSRQR